MLNGNRDFCIWTKKKKYKTHKKKKNNMHKILWLNNLPKITDRLPLKLQQKYNKYKVNR